MSQPSSSQSNSRPTLALLIDAITGFQEPFWTGTMSAAEALGVNLISFVGETIHHAIGNRYAIQRNRIYDYANEASVDGVIFLGNSLGNHVSPDEYVAFCDRFKHLPRVSIGRTLPGMPAILVNNETGMHDIISHLIKEHGRRKIVHIRGPESSVDAIQRFNVYQATLQEHGIPFDPNYVIPGDFSPEAGDRGVEMILERKLEFDAIICANDYMAIGALRTAKQRGFRVPFDVSIAGFDDIAACQQTTPQLSTVRQPTEMLGQKAVEVLLDMIRGKRVTSDIFLPTEVVIRQSCGCATSGIQEVLPSDKTRVSAPLKSGKSALEILHAALCEASNLKPTTELGQKILPVLDEFRREVLDGTENLFIPALDTLLNKQIEARVDLANWQNIISHLRNLTVPSLPDDAQRVRAENLCHQARVLIGVMLERAKMNLNAEASEQRNRLNEVAQKLGTSFDMNELMSIAASEFRHLDIPGTLVSVYGDDGRNEQRAQLLLACVGNQVLQTGGRYEDYPASEFFPKDLLPSDRPFYLVAQSLHYQEESLGFLALEAGSKDGSIYEAIFTQLRSSIKGALLLAQSRHAEAGLKRQNDQIHSLVLPMVEAIGQVSEISHNKMQSIRQLAKTTEISSQKIEETNREIGNVSTNMHKIAEMLTVIDEISATVDLLGINAAIESAHAGSFGRGFGVIAGEIRKLSESTKQNATDISNALGQVGSSISDSVTTGHESLQTFEEVATGVTDVLGALEMIIEKMEALSNLSQEILKVMNSFSQEAS